jgi:hypothetical protein
MLLKQAACLQQSSAAPCLDVPLWAMSGPTFACHWMHREMVMITLSTDLDRIQRTNLETCITVHMHQKESTEDLMRKKVRRTCQVQCCLVSPSFCVGFSARVTSFWTAVLQSVLAQTA